MRLLIVKPSSLGDVVHTFPAVDMLCRHLGDELESLTWVINESLSGILDLYPRVTRCVCFPRTKAFQWSAMKKFVTELRQEEYDVAIDFQGLLRSGLISWLSRAPRRIGFTNGRECSPLFYTEAYEPVSMARHAVDKNGDLVRQAFPKCGVQTVPELTVGRRWLEEADSLLGKNDGGPVLAVGFSSRWPSKNWPPAFFARILDVLARQNSSLRIWLLGTKDEQEQGTRLSALCQVARPLNLAGRSSMMGLVGLLQRSSVLLTNDSGPMHIAAALRKHCVALFGSTDPVLTGPYGEGLHTIIRSGCRQSPCFKKQCPKKGVECSEWTSPEEVAEAVKQKLMEKQK